MAKIKNMNKYNKDTLAVLKQKYAQDGLTKNEIILSLMKYFDISHRQARRVNSTHKIYQSNSIPVKQKIKRLFFDIETSPNIVLSWRVGYKINLSEENIISERKIICIGYKWEGEKQVHVLTWDDKQNDKSMLEKFLVIANSADEIVMQNGDKFDLPWFRTRCIFHGLQCPPDYKTVDTLKIARRNFYFNSNKLDYMAKFLGLGEKMHTSYGLWKEIVLNKCAKSLEKMVLYCGKDVILLEQVYNKLRGFVKQKTHEGVLAGRDKWSCPRCASEKVVKQRTRISASGTQSHVMRCSDCGGYHTVNDTALESYKLAKGR